MKNLSLLILVLLISYQTELSSQPCLPDGIEFHVQHQIDNFQINHPNCTEIEGDVIIQGPGINNLNGLSVLTSIGGYLQIKGNASLSSLSGLDNVTSIGGILEITDNNALTSLTGLENVVFIGENIEVSHNAALTSLSGINGLTSINQDLWIWDNVVLNSLYGLENLNSIAGSLKIGNFAWSWYDPCFGNPYLITLSGLNNLTTIGGNLEICCNDSLLSLSGIENLSSVGGNLDISRNVSLVNISSLDNLTSIPGDLLIGFGNKEGNPSLSSLTGLDNLTSVGGDLSIKGNEILTNLLGLNDVVSIGGNLYIYLNYGLTSLDGLESLSFVEGSLHIGYWNWWHGGGGGNPILTDINALNNLTSIGGDFEFRENSSLSSLTGLGDLTSIGGGLLITGHDALTSLAGLDDIDAGSINYLGITYNSNLAACEVQSICDFLASPNGTVTIYENKPGCNNQGQIIAACETVSVWEIPAEDQFIISPNPTHGISDIRYSIFDIRNVVLSVFDIHGKEIIRLVSEKQPAGDYTVRFDASDLPSGIYICILKTNEGIKTTKLIKL